MSTERTIGNYVLGPILGRGGMSDVHAAEHRFLGDRVAIKLLRSHLAGDPAATAAFIAEATQTRAIDHPGVVRVLDFGSDGDAFYLVMERLDGESLAARLERLGPLDEPFARRLGAAIAEAAEAAHARSIVHRDLKPGNIVLVVDQPRIIDFGIARDVARTAVTGSRLGTIAYMAPEQLTGGLVAPCIDIWALGVILYEALAGRLPFDGFADGRTPQLFETPPRLGELAAVSPALEAVIAACLDRDPGKRPPSMRALAQALREPAGDPRITEDLPPSAGRGDTGAGSIAPASPAVDMASRARDAGLASARIIEDSRTAAPDAIPHRRLRRRSAVALAALAVAIGAGGIYLARGRDAERSPGTPGGPPLAPGRAGHAERPVPAASATAVPERPPEPATVAIEVRSAPAGASIVVGGKRVGTTPATVAVALPASIVVTRAGYRPSRLFAERPGPIDVRLVPVRLSPHPARPAPPAPSARPAAGETLD
jgi:hypothetical protein